VPDVPTLVHSPRRHYARGRLVVAGGVVVDSFKSDSVSSDALDQPISLPVVDQPSAVSVADRLLDIGPPQAAFVKPKQGVSSPNETFDRHGVEILCGHGRLGEGPQVGHGR
jgi:hypothetical protein